MEGVANSSRMAATSSNHRRIIVDARPLQTADAERGIGRYVRGLLGALAAEGHGYRLAALVQSGLPLPELPDAGLVAYRVNRRWVGRLAVYEDAVQLPADLSRIQPLLFHATRLSLPARSPCPLVVTLHDLIPWALGGPRMLGERLRFRPALALLKRADTVIAVSQSTAEDAVRLAGVARSRIRVIGEGVDPRFRPAEGAAARVHERWGLSPPFLLFVGALDARKDPPALIQAWKVARAAVPELALAVAGAASSQAPRALAGARLLGRVSDADLIDLLSTAACLVFPSRYEGFGLPVLEAMACGCPVVAYRNSSIPEIAGGAAEMVEDGDAEGLGRAAAQFLTDRRRVSAARRQGMRRAADFTWEKVARQVANVYSELLA